MAFLQIALVIGPVLAPVVGGIIITYASWQATFWVLSVLGAACFALALLFEESLPVGERVEGGVAASISRLFRVGRNGRFLALLILMSLFCLPFMAYVATASYVYVDIFGQTEQMYSYHFAATSAFSVLGPVIYLRLSSRVTPQMFTHAIVAVCLACGIVLLIGGHLSPVLFCACFALFAVTEGIMRPYMTDILLAQQDSDAGSASSLINFLVNAFGVVGMAAMGIPWPDYITGLGVLMVGSVGCAAVLWALILHNPNLRPTDLG